MLESKGITALELGDATGSPQFFVDALAAAKAASPNGPMVSAKTLEEVTAPGTVPFMTKDGLAGAMVTADGDIEEAARRNLELLGGLGGGGAA